MVRDRYSLISKRFKQKTNIENKASGICPPEENEIDQALQNITELFGEADAAREKETSDKKSKQCEDLEKAQEIRRKSLETFKRTTDSEDGPRK